MSVDSIERPDYTIIDLAPADVPFPKVVEVDVTVRQIVEKGAEGYFKTSGKCGLHVYIPLGRKYTFDQSIMFSKLVARMVHHQFPAITSLDPRAENRKGLIYLDTKCNASGQGVAAKFSARPLPGATVSAPTNASNATIPFKSGVLIHWQLVREYRVAASCDGALITNR